MTVTYTASLINTRLGDVVTAIGSSGIMNLYTSSGAFVSSITLATPVGSVSGGILTFGGLPRGAPLTSAGGYIASATITDSSNNLVVTGLTVGTSTASDIVMASTLVSSGQTLTLTYATITGR